MAKNHQSIILLKEEMLSKPIAEKLQIKQGKKVLLVNEPKDTGQSLANFQATQQSLTNLHKEPMI
jgi:hypothetical protein